MFPFSTVAERFGTPVYVYTEDGMRQNVERFMGALSKVERKLVCFAVKANTNPHILRRLQSFGVGADCVSLGEVKLALTAGIPPDRIIFNGVGKSTEEIQFSIESQIRQLNVESMAELLNIERVAKKLGMKPSVAIRLNPNVEAKTHRHLTTGCSENKFGLEQAEAFEAAVYAWKSSDVKFVGLSVHIGSQIDRLEPFQLAFEQLSNCATRLMSMGVQLTTLDFGGGVGVKYKDEDLVVDWREYGSLVAAIAARFPQVEVLLEPGRCLMANTACLLARVIYVKITPTKNFLVVDAGMNDLLRPALYGATHKCWPVERHKSAEAKLVRYCVVGPVCESADVFQSEVEMLEMSEGDLVAFDHVGAYGMSMASEYNMRPMAAEVLITADGQMQLIRRRRTFDDILAPFSRL